MTLRRGILYTGGVDTAERIAEDVRAWLECGRPISADARIAAYQHALALAVALREAMDDEDAPLSVWAEWSLREDECLGIMRVLERARAALRMAVEEAERTGGRLSHESRTENRGIELVARQRGRVKPEQAREHERRAWELRQRGWTHTRIAAEIGVHLSAVGPILQRVSKRVLEEMGEDVARHKVEQDARLDWIIDEMAQAWQRSQQAARTITRRTMPGENGQGGTETTTAEVEERVGEAGYVDRILAALRSKAKLWGLDAATRTEVSGPGGKPMEVKHAGIADYSPAAAALAQSLLAGIQAGALREDGSAEPLAEGAKADPEAGPVPPA